MYNIVSEEQFEAGQVIFKENSSGDWVYVVLSGSVEISKIVNGKKFIVAEVREGEVFGELSFLGNIKRTATAIALEDSTVGIIDRESLDTEFNKLSSDFRSIIVAAARRFGKMLDRASDFSERTEPRIARTLTLTYKDKDAFIKAYTGNISIGGLYIKTKKPLKQGEKFILKLQLPDMPEPLNIKSEVAWARKEAGGSDDEGPGMGIKFIDINDKDQRILNQYIEGIGKI